MGSLGIKPIEANQNPNFTPPHNSPGEKDGDANMEHLVQNTVPFDDVVHVEDAFETQVLDVCCDTQVLDDSHCVQIMETQLVDGFSSDSDCVQLMETQLVDGFVSDGEESDKTEVLDDSDEFSDGESRRSSKGESFHVENTSHDQSKNLLVEKPNEKCSPTVSAPRFTSIRAASFRASGLAARRKYLEGTNSESSSLLTSNQHLEEGTVKINGSKTLEEADQASNGGTYTVEVEGLIKGNNRKISRPTMRRLFNEDCEDEELVSSSNKVVGDEEILQSPAGVDGLAGLSYIDSQEPGDLSQANALACVQRLIEDSKELFNGDFDLGKSSKGKSYLLSMANGPRNLAKKTNHIEINVKTGIFDWDDGREDEGGGDIFRRRKEEFLGRNLGQRSLPKPKTAKGNQLDGYGNNRGKSDVQIEKVSHSDSKIVLHSIKPHDEMAPESEMSVRKNLVNEFDEQRNQSTRTASPTKKNMPEVLNVGLDTQMAAEAMEALFNGDGVPNSDGNDAAGNSDCLKRSQARKGENSSHSNQQSFDKDFDIGVSTRRSRKMKRICETSSEQPSISQQKHSETTRIERDKDLVVTRSKRAKLDAEVLLTKINMVNNVPSKMADGPTRSGQLDEFKVSRGTAAFTPVAHRTRQAFVTSRFKTSENMLNCCGKETNCPMEVAANQKTIASTSVEATKALDAKGKSSEPVSGFYGELENTKSKSITMSSGISCPRRRRSSRQLSGQLNEICELDAQSKQSSHPVNVEKSTSMHKRSRRTAKIITLEDLKSKRKTRSSRTFCLDLPSVYPKSDGELSPRDVDKSGSGGASHNCSSSTGSKISKNKLTEKECQLPDGKNNKYSSLFAEHESSTDNLPEEATEPSKSKCVSPVNIMKSVDAVSPVIIGDKPLERSCSKSFSRSFLVREISGLSARVRESSSSPKDLRRRRDLANVSVMFSHHLDGDIVKQQRKIVDRLKISTASSIADATHFVADEFLRTRNMLEAIASGKPVVTHLWLENVGQAKYYVDEQKYILRDTKKEKEIGFNLPVSLARANLHPLLEGRRVLITPKTKPGKEIISGLVKAVSGQAVERVGRSALKDDTIPDDLLILSCEEDYEACVHFLEKGAAVYSSELLLNGIVTQMLEYERHRLFADHVKRTRSTIWTKRGGDNFLPVRKHK